MCYKLSMYNVLYLCISRLLEEAQMFLGLCSHTSQNRHGCRFRSNAYKDVCLLRWRTYRNPISEFLEHLASYNGADMHKYNTLYTRKLSWHVLTPTSQLLDFVASSQLISRSLALYVISVRRTGDLLTASFRFHLTLDTLGFCYILPTTRVDQGLSPIRNVCRQAHN